MTSTMIDHPAVQDAIASNALWVLVRVGSEHLVLPSQTILEMVRAPAAHALPFAPPDVRGVATLRGQVGLLIDMRTRLGLESLQQEQRALVDLLHAREKDHRLWLDDLEGSVREDRPFLKTLDPHACAFGTWYDTYEAPTLELAWHLRQFAEPHAKIHEVGSAVALHMLHNRQADALALINHTHDTVLKRLVDLFDGARRLVATSSREIAVVVNVSGRSVGLVVDEVEGIDQLKSDTLEAMPAGFGSDEPSIIGTARTRREDKVVLVIDLEELTQGFGLAAPLAQ